MYKRQEIDAVNVDVTSSGFDGVLGSGDNTVQKALQKVDDYVPTETVDWTRSFTSITSELNVTNVTGVATKIGNVMMLRGSFRVSMGENLNSAQLYVSAPATAAHQTYGVVAGIHRPLQYGLVSQMRIESNQNRLLLYFNKNTGQIDNNFSYMIAYTIK